MIERDKLAVRRLMDEIEVLVCAAKPEVAVAALSALNAQAMHAFAQLRGVPLSEVARAMHRQIDALAEAQANLRMH